MTAPQRIQLRRTKGWRKPDGAIVVARPSRWGNPYRVVPIPRTDAGLDRLAAADKFTVCDNQVAVDLFADDLGAALANYHDFTIDERFHRIAESLAELRGHDLACWCPLDQPCHADVLLELANKTTP